MNDDEVAAWIAEMRADDDRIDKVYEQLESAKETEEAP